MKLGGDKCFKTSYVTRSFDLSEINHPCGSDVAYFVFYNIFLDTVDGSEIRLTS